MLRNLQIWHVLWLGITPILFGLFTLSSEPHDADRVLVDNLIVMAGAIWVGCVAVYFVRTGKKDDALPGLLRLYRGLLENRWFLLAANIAGTALVLVIGYKLIFFRQVEFVSTADAALLLNDKPAQPVFVGIVRGRTPTSFRLRVGSHKVVFHELGTEESLGSATVVVPCLFREPGKIQEHVVLRKEPDYDSLR